MDSEINKMRQQKITTVMLRLAWQSLPCCWRRFVGAHDLASGNPGLFRVQLIAPRATSMVLSGVCLFEGGGLKKGTPSYFAGVPELAF
jgi:hypothetical protein